MVLFHVPCPTPDGQSARDLYEKRLPWITAEMQASGVLHGCRFHRAWYAENGSAFYALAMWETGEGARAFFQQWEIAGQPGETAIVLQGDVGLVPVP